MAGGDFLHEDNALMQFVQQGDRTAFETLMIKHRVAATYFANSFIHDIDISEDIVQESFISVYMSRMNYKPIHTFKTYLFTVVRNHAIDYLRKKKTTMAWMIIMISHRTLAVLMISTTRKRNYDWFNKYLMSWKTIRRLHYFFLR